MDDNGMSTSDEQRKRKIKATDIIILSESEYETDSEVEEKQGELCHLQLSGKAKGRICAKSTSEIHIDVEKYKQGMDPRRKVKYFLEEFDNLRVRFEEEKRQPGYAGDSRPSIRALKALSKYRYLVNGSKSINGQVPGVKMGQTFKYRAQISLICLHQPTQAGIDFMKVNVKQFRGNVGLAMCSPKGQDVSIAVSVVVSDRKHRSEYENGLDLNEIWYKSQGRDNETTKGQAQDHKPVPANLALKHSYHLGLPVRVIRTDKEGLFLYDGFYDVKTYKDGKRPFRYDFLLVRRPRGSLYLCEV